MQSPYAEVEALLGSELAAESKVLDAGAGRKCVFTMPGRITGLDVSDTAMALNPRLDERLIGDLMTEPLSPDYDAVVCVDLLEHLPDPQGGLANMLRALRPGGLLVLGFPIPTSPKGLVTKFTPLSFHVWVSRRIFKSKNAGKPGVGPFPTFMRMSPRYLRRFAQERGLEIVIWREWEAPKNSRLRTRNRVAQLLWRIVELAYRVPGGDPKHTELMAVLRVPQAQVASAAAK